MERSWSVNRHETFFLKFPNRHSANVVIPHIFLPPCTLPLWSVDKPRSAAHRVCAYCRRSAYLILPLQHHRQWKKQWSRTKSCLTYTISHQIWVFTASIVVKWPVGWLISKPAVNKMERLSLSFFCQHLWYCCCLLYPYCLPSFAPLSNEGHQITTFK